MLVKSGIPNSLGVRSVFNFSHLLCIEVIQKPSSPRLNSYHGTYALHMFDTTSNWSEILYVGTKQDCADQLDSFFNTAFDNHGAHAFSAPKPI